MAKISPLALVDPKASLADDVEIGPFCVVGPQVTLARGCKLHNSVTLIGHTKVGQGNTFFPNCVVGAIPQDKKYRGEPSRLEIGERNEIRENVTIHLGTEKGGWVTKVGNNNLLMVNAHIAHDAQFGDNCIIGNNVMIAGHVVCGSNVAMMGAVGVHHFVTIGDFAYIGGYARVRHDVPPFLKVDGADQVRGLNILGLKRGQFTETDIEALDDACRRLFYRDKPFAQALGEFDMMNGINPHVKTLIEFLHRRDLGKHGRYLEGARCK